MKFFCAIAVFLFTLTLSDRVFANVVGTDAQNFNSITSGLDFVTVQSSETLKPGIINFGLFFNYAVNTLPYFEASPQSRTNYNDALLGADFNMGVGLAPNWDVGISFPFVLDQEIESSTGFRGQFAETGNTEVRLNSKYRLYGDDSGGIALVGSVNFNQIENNPWAGADAGPTFNLELAADTTIDKAAVGFNIGHRWRNPGTPLTLPGVQIEPYGNQLIASVAVSYLLNDVDTKLIGEIFGATPTSTTSSDVQREQSSLEALIGIKYDYTPSLAFHFGGGTELINGTASPDWRVYAGLNFTIGPVFRKSAVQKIEVSQTPLVERFITHNVNFEFDSDRLTDAAKVSIDEFVDSLKQRKFKSLVIEGHTDSVGSDDYNLKLSNRRAHAIERYLVAQHGFDAKAIQSIGYGESRPIADNGNYQGRQENRRVEFQVTY